MKRLVSFKVAKLIISQHGVHISFLVKGISHLLFSSPYFVEFVLFFNNSSMTNITKFSSLNFISIIAFKNDDISLALHASNFV